MTLREVLTAAVADFAEHGFDSDQRLRTWVDQIRMAAQAEMVPDQVLQAELEQTFRTIYARLVERGDILRRHPGISRYSLQMVRPQLQDELARRILASASLIRLNREAAIDDTLRRFQGWATSVPVGGSPVVKRREVRAETRKDLASLGYQARRVAIDQGHKFVSSLNQILATDGGAIAAIWHRHHTRYPREAHKKLDGQVLLVRDSWAHERGLVKPGKAGYTDQVEQPAELVNCRCSYEFIYALRRLPKDMVTKMGAEEMERVRQEMAA